jgi:hypothetical protein
MEGRPLDAAIIVGHADSLTWYPQVDHSLGDGKVDILGVPQGEVPGVRHGVGPQAPLRRRRADHGGDRLSNAPEVELDGEPFRHCRSAADDPLPSS